MRRFLSSLIPSFLRASAKPGDSCTPAPLQMKPVAETGGGEFTSPALPPSSGLEVDWCVVDGSRRGTKTIAKGKVVVYAMTEDQVRANLTRDLQRLFPRWTADHDRDYVIRVTPVAA